MRIQFLNHRIKNIFNDLEYNLEHSIVDHTIADNHIRPLIEASDSTER